MMISLDGLETFYPKNRSEWRAWLETNHQLKQSVWLVFYRTSSIKANLRWGEAVEEALCYGWIDSTRKTIDEEQFIQYFSRRKPGSTWSKVNKDKVAMLTQNKLMTKAGYDCINIAKQNGNWSYMDDVENLIIPDDLQLALNDNENALAFFQNQSNSSRKAMLYWIAQAKRSETRMKRISELVQSAILGKRPKHFG